eukprot:Lithocolla_globosa_v1_NODE_7719_length_909_cov_3.210773.p2 type:complete len:163 gc:universal NODE_7719_length_909_cov_3.210773:699-211(-)
MALIVFLQTNTILPSLRPSPTLFLSLPYILLLTSPVSLYPMFPMLSFFKMSSPLRCVPKSSLPQKKLVFNPTNPCLVLVPSWLTWLSGWPMIYSFNLSLNVFNLIYHNISPNMSCAGSMHASVVIGMYRAQSIVHISMVLGQALRLLINVMFMMVMEIAVLG